MMETPSICTRQQQSRFLIDKGILDKDKASDFQKGLKDHWKMRELEGGRLNGSNKLALNGNDGNWSPIRHQQVHGLWIRVRGLFDWWVGGKGHGQALAMIRHDKNEPHLASWHTF